MTGLVLLVVFGLGVIVGFVAASVLTDDGPPSYPINEITTRISSIEQQAIDQLNLINDEAKRHLIEILRERFEGCEN